MYTGKCQHTAEIKGYTTKTAEHIGLHGTRDFGNFGGIRGQHKQISLGHKIF